MIESQSQKWLQHHLLNISEPLVRWSPDAALTFITLIQGYAEAISKLYQGQHTTGEGREALNRFGTLGILALEQV